MARIPAKIIEKKLAIEEIELDGYYVLDSLSTKAIEEAKEQGMEDGITHPYDFSATLEYRNFTLEFYCSMVEDYREMNGEEIPYYYLSVDSCKIIRKDKEELVIDIGVYEK
jgi:hypothetical protein